MKKPKPAKPRKVSNQPREFANLKLMLGRMAYSIDLGMYRDSEIELMKQWCSTTIKQHNWNYTGGWPGTMYFESESDLTMFALRWITK